jgi:hypothetical protein
MVQRQVRNIRCLTCRIIFIEYTNRETVVYTILNKARGSRRLPLLTYVTLLLTAHESEKIKSRAVLQSRPGELVKLLQM